MGTIPLQTASSTYLCLRMVVCCWVVGDRVGHLACFAMVWVGFQSVRVLSPRYKGHVFKWSQVSSSALPEMHLGYSKKKCFSIALRHTLVVLEMH